MKKNLLLGFIAFTAGSLMAAEIDTVTNAAAALGGSANYSWSAVTEVPDGGFGAGTTSGKTEKDGYTWVSMDRNNNTTEAFLKGTNIVIKTDSGWQTIAEATADNGGGGGGFNPAMFVARQLQGFKSPAEQAIELAGQAKALKTEGDVILGDLTDDNVKSQLSFRGRGGRRGGNGGGMPAPEISNPKGSVKFWVADGKITKFEVHLSGSMSFNGNDINVDRTTTTTIKDVGTTKIEVPDDAKKKF